MRQLCSTLAAGVALAILGALPVRAAFDLPLWNVVRTNAIVYGVGAVEGGAASMDLLLDLYEPEGNPDPNKPAMVLIHGGGFTGGNRDNMSSMASYYAARGYVTVSITYRLLGDDPVADPSYGFFDPTIAGAVHAAAVDAKRAIRWLRANADSLGVDPALVFAGGFSAGAFTAMHAGATDDGVFLTDLPGQTPLAANHPGESSTVASIFDLCGGLMPPGLDPSDPPILIVHTTGDSIVTVALADFVETRCIEEGIPHEYYRLERSGHCDFGGVIADDLDLFAIITRFQNRFVWEVAPPDADDDGIPDALDNCTDVPNGTLIPDTGGNSQLDSDDDGYGNACDCDLDQSLTCNINDFNVFLPDFTAAVDSGVGTDMDGDGSVGIGDFNLFLPGFAAGEPGPSGLAP